MNWLKEDAIWFIPWWVVLIAPIFLAAAYLILSSQEQANKNRTASLRATTMGQEVHGRARAATEAEALARLAEATGNGTRPKREFPD